MTRFLWLGLVLCLITVAPLAAQSTVDRTVEVSGEATVRAAPDQATIRFAVVTRADTPEEARAENSDASSSALRAVRDMTIPEEQIRMEQLQVRPHRVYDQEQRRQVERGYEAMRAVQVEVHDIDQVPDLVVRVMQAGANRLQSVQYGLSDREPVRNEALAAAASNARAKADRLAEALGESVAAVQQIREEHFSFPRTARQEVGARMMMDEQAAADPEAYAPGEIEVEARVLVIFGLQDPVD